MTTLAGKRVAVLGGSSGIGLEVARQAAAEGAHVVVVSSHAERVAEAVDALDGRGEGRTADLTDAAAIGALFGDLGPIDHLAYTAGEALQLTLLAEMDLAKARGFFTLRYWGAVAAAQAAAPLLRPGGSIVLTSGVAGARPSAGWSVAASLCAAMIGLTRALAVELAPIRVNVVSPGVVKTPLWRDMNEAAREALYAGEARRLPVGHVAEPAEIAEGYLFLMRQTYASGQVLTLDGGGLLA